MLKLQQPFISLGSRILGGLLALAIVFISLVVTQARAFDIPAPQGFINDYAQILSSDFVASQESQLQALSESELGGEIAVVTITSLAGEPIEDVAQQFFDQWQIGQKNTDNGVLVLIAVEDREIRIQTGYGAETVITDSIAGRIIRDEMTPAFQQGNYQVGIDRAVASLTKYLNDPELAEQDAQQTSLIDIFPWALAGYFALIFGMSFFTYGVAFFARTKSWWLGGVIGAILGLIFAQVLGGIFFGLLGLLLDYLLSKNYKILTKAGLPTTWKQSWGGFSSGSSGSSGGFSGFSGGSSGGGGASGKW